MQFNWVFNKRSNGWVNDLLNHLVDDPGYSIGVPPGASPSCSYLLNCLVPITMLDKPSAMPGEPHVELRGTDHKLSNRRVTPIDKHCSLRGLVNRLLNYPVTRQINGSLMHAY